MNKTHIQWCDYTSNPIKYRDEDGTSVWACVKVSDGCKNCYAEALAKRYGRGGPFTVGATAKVTPYFDEAEAKALLSPKRLPAGSKVFIGDMTDVFGPWVPDELLDRLFAVFALRPDVVFQVLTKRPERMRAYMHWRDEERGLVRQGAVQYVLDVQHARGEWGLDNGEWPKGRPQLAGYWPLPNVWLGVSAEDQQRWDERVPELLATPATVRFVSAEPLLGAIDCSVPEIPATDPDYPEVGVFPADAVECLDWVIVGGESGPGARPCDIGWIRGIVGQCQAAGTAVFVKQLGAKPFTSNAGLPWADEHPVTWYRYKDRKGGNPDEWPKDLRVREFPEVAR